MKGHLRFKKAAAMALSVSLLAAPVPSTFSTYVSAKEFKAEDILAALTSEQRAALHTLQTSEQTGLKLDPSVNLDSEEPVNVIIQFKESPVKTAKAESLVTGKTFSISKAKENVEFSHSQFQKDIESIFGKEKKGQKDTYKVNHSYKNAFNGVTMTLPASQVKELLKSEVVKTVWSDLEVKVDPPVKVESKKSIPTTNHSSGIQQLHEEGVTGKGIKVGVIDTGIDYNHPDLKEAYKGGYDFVDDDSDPMEATYQNWKDSNWPEYSSNGNTYYTLHGTHVAGIIAGKGTNSSEFATTGVAPEADLYAYRVLGPYGTGITSDIIAAIDTAVSDGMDVINLSLGAAINDPFYPTSIAVNHAVLAGVTAVIAAGNSGNGMKTLGSPGTSTLGLTVGANDTAITVPSYKGSIGSIDVSLRLMARNLTDDLSLLDGKISIVDVGLGQAADYTGKDVKGKAVLISRGETSFDAKIKLAKTKGAAAVLLFNNIASEGHIPFYIGETANYIPTFSLTNEEGLLVKNLASSQAEVSFTRDGEFTIDGGNLADFSSRGPSRIQYEIKPEVTAPGVFVRSTVPSYANGASYLGNYEVAYQRLSGTSMASPYVAGVAALLLQQQPDLTPDEIKSIVMNTADPLKKDYSVFEAGSGQVDAYEAVHSQMEIMVENPSVTITNGEEEEIISKSGALNFGSSLHTGEKITESRTITLTNHDKHPKTFEVKVEFQTDLRDSKDALKNGVSLDVDKKVITVPGNKEIKSNVSIVVPGLAEIGSYEGFVTYVNKHDRSEVYQIPFAFVVTEEGFHSMKADPNVLSSDYVNYLPYVTYKAGISFNSKSVMETLDFVLLDGKSDKEIGFLGTLDVKSLIEDTEYYVNSVFQRTYFPFTGDPNQPISDKSVPVPYGPGHYKVKMIGTNKEGKTFSMTDDVMIDITGPTFTTELAEGVIEYEPGTTSYPIKGSIIDQSFEGYKKLGMDVDQSRNLLLEEYNAPFMTNLFAVDDADGNFTYTMKLNPAAKSDTLELAAYNSAGIGTEYKKFTFVPEGSPYVYGSTANKTVKMGENIKLTLTANNVTEAKKLVSSFTFMKDAVEVVEVKAHPAIEEQGQVAISTQLVPSGSSKTILNVNLELVKGKVSGDIPFAEVILKVKDETYKIHSPFSNPTALYQNEKGISTSMVSAVSDIWIVPSFSKISSNLPAPQPLRKENSASWKPSIDPSAIGIELAVRDQAGNRYSGTISRSGQMSVEKLPLTVNEMEFSINIPGHFTVYHPFQVGFVNDQGTITGHWNMEIYTDAAIPGDVNKDNVIDIMDALYMEEKWQTAERHADINFDGIVDANDMKYIQEHYLKKNPTLRTAPEPLEIHEGKTLEDILEKLGLK
ncbi:S8 family serine peptidase [Neobacillus niacini]|uniref:S8 family serine peptidase n=1 Tax=Neobacillus niacini TaxID=86668 RepID=UPI003983720B